MFYKEPDLHSITYIRKTHFTNFNLCYANSVLHYHIGN